MTLLCECEPQHFIFPSSHTPERQKNIIIKALCVWMLLKFEFEYKFLFLLCCSMFISFTHSLAIWLMLCIFHSVITWVNFSYTHTFFHIYYCDVCLHSFIHAFLYLPFIHLLSIITMTLRCFIVYVTLCLHICAGIVCA
jgi:hypothetical protein